MRQKENEIVIQNIHSLFVFDSEAKKGSPLISHFRLFTSSSITTPSISS